MEKNYWQEYFNNVSPTWMEKWYEDLKELTIPSACFQMTKEECNEMLNLMDGNADISVINSFKEKLRKTFSKIEGHQVFVRLGSRSAKDNPTVIGDENDVVSSFGDSERIVDDLMLCLKNKYLPYVFVREWREIPKDKEFRCFVKDGELRGITQYFYRDKYYYLDSVHERDNIKARATELLLKIKKKFKLNNFIFDIVYNGNDPALLIEINPYSSWTDSCLFDWALDKFDEFKFKWLQDI